MRPDVPTPADGDRGRATAVSALAALLVVVLAVVVPAVRFGVSPYVAGASTGVIGLAAAAIAGAIWIAVLGLVARRALRRVLEIDGPFTSRETRLVVAALSGLFAIGLDWGLPGPGWALDEMGADAVLAGWGQGFANGWSDQYPPLHYYLLMVVYAPVLVLERAGMFAASWPAVKFLLLLFARQLSLAMAIGTIALMGVLGDRLLGRRHGWIVALCAGLFLPFVFYAKTANLEAPYLFWTALALVFMCDAGATGRTRSWIGAGASAALAVATKDHAYGLFVLPFLALAWTHVRASRPLAAVAGGVAAGVVAFALAHNMIFNLRGFEAHVAMVTGPASQPFRMFDYSLAGQIGLAAMSTQALLWMVGAAGAIALVCGVVALMARAAPRLPLWLLLAPLSCYLTFLVPVGYVYDRFLLPVTLACSPVAAVGIRRLLDGWPGRGLGRACGIGMLIVLGWRAASVDALMLRDSRYAAETWLQTNVPPGSVIATPSRSVYLPRIAGEYQHLDETVDATLELGPAIIVVNVELLRRDPPDSPPRLWLRWLETGVGPYEQVFRYKAPLGPSALRMGRRFRDGIEDPLTNLDKINPEIAVFQRRGG
jgi:hypothetical protein